MFLFFGELQNVTSKQFFVIGGTHIMRIRKQFKYFVAGVYS